MPAESPFSAMGGRVPFASTQWSVVRAAGQRSTPDARVALETLCQAYWFPLYGYVRRQGHQVSEAQDLTQAFFVSLLERDDLRHLTPDQGRFRTFLLASLKHFLINEWHKARALKRGGGQRVLSLDFEFAERRLACEATERQTPQSLFERQWAQTLLERVRQQIRDEMVAADQTDRWETLKCYLAGDSRSPSYAEAGSRLGMTEAAVKMAVHRLRRRFHDLLRQEIGQTVSSPEEIDDEIRTLLSALQTPR